MSDRNQIKCSICGVFWPEHQTEFCPYGRQLLVEPTPEPVATPKPCRVTKLINEGIIYQAVAAQLKAIERRLENWAYWGRWISTEHDRANDECRARVLREWLETHQ